MPKDYFSANKYYDDSCFILTDSKLTRIIEVAKERLSRNKTDTSENENYEVTFKDGKEIKLKKLDAVLSLDNSNKNPIVKIDASMISSNDDENFHSISITFGGRKASDDRSIWIYVSSKDLGWMQETMGALEEQVERTIPNDIAYAINKQSNIFIFFTLLVLITSLASFIPSSKSSTPTNDQLEKLAAIAENSVSDSEKINFVFQYLSSTTNTETTAKQIKIKLQQPRTYFIGVPLLICLASIAAIIFFFHPRNIFVWGDIRESYEKTIERRKFLWTGVILSLAIGVLGNFFVLGTTSM